MSLSSAQVWGLFLGASAGIGILLMLSPLLWGRSDRAPQESSQRNVKLSEEASVLGMKPSQMVFLSAVFSVIAGATAWVATGVVAVAIIAALAGGMSMRFIAHTRRALLRKQARNVWPDVVDAVISALRSGANIPDALISLSTFSVSAVSKPAAQFAHDYTLSGNFSESVNALKTRWGSAQADRIVETLRLGRELGGSEITTVLHSLGAHLRSESALRQELEARQGWIKVAARIGVLAPWVVLVLLSTRAETAAAYNSLTGLLIVAVGAGLTVVAYSLMNRIGVLPEEPRWLA
jgi:tight adherence protein B